MNLLLFCIPNSQANSDDLWAEGISSQPFRCFSHSVHKVAGQALGFRRPRAGAAAAGSIPAVCRRGTQSFCVVWGAPVGERKIPAEAQARAEAGGSVSCEHGVICSQAKNLSLFLLRGNGAST